MEWSYLHSTANVKKKKEEKKKRRGDVLSTGIPTP